MGLDSYFSNVALKQILIDVGADRNEALEYERGCILNFLSFTGSDGFMPIMIARNSKVSELRPKDIYKENMHKPILAQHAAFLVKYDNGNAEWLRNDFQKLHGIVKIRTVEIYPKFFQLPRFQSL